MLAEAGDLDSADETSREYERVVDPKYLDQIWTESEAIFYQKSLASPELPSAQSETLRTEKTPSSRVLCES
jgi:hypothetical protein